MVAVVEQSQQTDEQLAVQAAEEDSNGPAFMALLERHRGRVWRICYRLMGDHDDAADAAQEVFVRLFLQRSRFDARSKFTTWLYGIALRTCLTLRRGHGRRRMRETTAAEAIGQQTTTGDADNVDLSLDLMRMLDTLNEEDRAMVILKYAEEYSYEELSAMFNLSLSACKMRISRAREKLQRQFPQEAGTE